MIRIGFIGLLFLLTVYIPVINSQEILHLDFDDEGQYTKEKISGKELKIYNHFNRPERINATFDKALRLDGWSTYIATNELNINSDRNISIEVWYATEAFSKEPASFLDCSDNGNSFSLNVTPYGYINFNFTLDNSTYSLTSSQPIKTYEWQYIVAVVDFEKKEARILINGMVSNVKSLPNYNSLNFSSSQLIVGKGYFNKTFSGFSTNILNGSIDKLLLHSKALSNEDILSNYQSQNIAPADLSIDHNIRHKDDYLRPRFHAMPNTGWTNEAYGLLYYNNKYHLFFQKNPNGPYLYFMHWGHLTSDDLVSWKEEKIALRPQVGFSNFGKWSGAAIVDNQDVPVLIYTGVDGSKAKMGIAFPEDSLMISWNDQYNQPIIEGTPAGQNLQDFRDPYVWKEGDLYYMVIGSGYKNNGGGVLVSYTSKDLKVWQNIPPIFKSNAINSSGTFWEMPYFNKISDTDYLLVVTPQFSNQRARSIYWIGSFNGSSFLPYHPDPKPFEIFSDNVLAPAIGKDANDKSTYLGIIPEDRSVDLQIEAGWRHVFSLPKQIRLLNDSESIAQTPHPNLCRARQGQVQILNKVIQKDTHFNLEEFEGNQVELSFNIFAPNVDQFFIQVFKNDLGTEFTNIIFDKKLNRIGLNRYLSSPYNTAKDLRYFDYSFNPNDSIRISIFLDHSVLEVFVDNLLTFSTRIYPSNYSNKIDLITADGDLFLSRFYAWNIRDKEETFQDIECPLENLPGGLYTGLSETYVPTDIDINPNPAHDHIHIKINKGSKKIALVQLFGIDGRLLNEFEVDDETQLVLSIPSIPDSIILVNVVWKDGSTAVKKIIIN